MKKTAIRRLFTASIPAALIVASTVANASASAPPAHGFVARPTLGARPSFHRNANSTPRTTFVGGGATLPALAYIGSSALTQNPGLPQPNSVFGEFFNLTGVTLQYCQTGSGFGKEVFDGAGPNITGGVNGTCVPTTQSPAYPDGFGAPPSLGLTEPDVTGSDAPMSQTEYSLFTTDETPLGFGEPVELPSIIGSIALLYNNPDVTKQINLTDAQICEIVEGKITNWSQLGFKSRALFFVYRTGGSGTTFGFSNHLLAACGASSGLNTSQNFTGATAPNVSVFPGTLPLNFVGESGNVGVTNEVVAQPGYIGYVEAANAKTAVGGSVNFAEVNKHDPIKNLPETAATFNYSAKNIALDSAVVTTGGPATVAKLTGVPGKAGCVVVPVPQAYADIKTSTGYPIIAVTNLLFLSAGNGSNATNLQELITELNTPAYFTGGQITSVNAATKAAGTGTTGYAALGSTFNKPIPTAAKNCIGA